VRSACTLCGAALGERHSSIGLDKRGVSPLNLCCLWGNDPTDKFFRSVWLNQGRIQSFTSKLLPLRRTMDERLRVKSWSFC
jgi:hypothetical protein